MRLRDILRSARRRDELERADAHQFGIRVLRLSQDLPVLIEVVDTEEHIQRLLPILEEMVPEGMVTMEKVRVLRYAPRR